MNSPLVQVFCGRRLSADVVATALAQGIVLSSHDLVDIQWVKVENMVRALQHNRAVWVFSSQHAVRFFGENEALALEQLQQNVTYCIEGITATQAQKMGFDVRGTAEDASHLAKMMIQAGVESVAHVTTQKRLHTMEALLTAAQVYYRAYEVYEKTDRPIRVNNFDALMFLSPSQVESFLKINQIPPQTPIFCIGATTAEFLKNKGYQHVFAAPTASLDAMLSAVVQYFTPIR
jgi:uroporphyrinogen-III synthase